MKMLYMYDNKNLGMYEILSLFITFNFTNLVTYRFSKAPTFPVSLPCHGIFLICIFITLLTDSPFLNAPRFLVSLPWDFFCNAPRDQSDFWTFLRLPHRKSHPTINITYVSTSYHKYNIEQLSICHEKYGGTHAVSTPYQSVKQWFIDR